MINITAICRELDEHGLATVTIEDAKDLKEVANTIGGRLKDKGYDVDVKVDRDTVVIDRVDRTSGPKYPDVHVKLTGTDGNAMMIIGRVSAVLRKAKGAEAAKAFQAEAMSAGSYDQVLQICMMTVDVS